MTPLNRTERVTLKTAITVCERHPDYKTNQVAIDGMQGMLEESSTGGGSGAGTTPPPATAPPPTGSLTPSGGIVFKPLFNEDGSPKKLDSQDVSGKHITTPGKGIEAPNDVILSTLDLILLIIESGSYGAYIDRADMVRGGAIQFRIGTGENAYGFRLQRVSQVQLSLISIFGGTSDKSAIRIAGVTLPSFISFKPVNGIAIDGSNVILGGGIEKHNRDFSPFGNLEMNFCGGIFKSKSVDSAFWLGGMVGHAGPVLIQNGDQQGGPRFCSMIRGCKNVTFKNMKRNGALPVGANGDIKVFTLDANGVTTASENLTQDYCNNNNIKVIA